MYEWVAWPQSPAQGWQCPCCGHVYSPTTSMCSYCPPKTAWSNVSPGYYNTPKYKVTYPSQIQWDEIYWNDATWKGNTLKVSPPVNFDDEEDKK